MAGGGGGWQNGPGRGWRGGGGGTGSDATMTEGVDEVKTQGRLSLFGAAPLFHRAPLAPSNGPLQCLFTPRFPPIHT